MIKNSIISFFFTILLMSSSFSAGSSSSGSGDSGSDESDGISVEEYIINGLVFNVATDRENLLDVYIQRDPEDVNDNEHIGNLGDHLEIDTRSLSSMDDEEKRELIHIYLIEGLKAMLSKEDIIPGTIANIIVSLSSEDGYSNTSVIPLQIGIPTEIDPMGPDDYGYYIYDSGDIDYLIAPSYEWIEIDSRYDGNGSHLSSLSDNGDNGDDVETVNLPFNFRFYGQDYERLSICSNGWIAFGETELSSFRNYPLPGAGGPGKMVAVFWDDLKTTNSGRVYTWYDEINKLFIVQWSRVRTFQNNTSETFQVILRDPMYYTTPTGDGVYISQDDSDAGRAAYIVCRVNYLRPAAAVSWNDVQGFIDFASQVGGNDE